MKVAWRWAALVAWTAFILVCMLNDVPTLRRWLEFLLGPSLPSMAGGWDKAVHALVYCVWGLLLHAAAFAPRRAAQMSLPWLAALSALVALSVLQEGLQGLVPTRVPSALDLLANVAGGFAGMVVPLGRRTRKTARFLDGRSG